MMCRWVWLALCVAVVPGCVSVNGGSRPMGSIGQADLPQPGEWVKVTHPERRQGLQISRSETTGRVESLDKSGLRLSHVTARTQSSTQGLSRLPVVGRMYKNTGVGRTEEETVVQYQQIEQLSIIPESEGLPNSSSHSVAQQLTAAVPGPQRLSRRL